ncbi:c-type cytochrome [Cognatilysobacter terrigena]|uniref:c-type cytochrome n=1 Tax=Cognatilysobacter terrigena TaxID=2488749 RepID=UPI00105CDE16|nr:cytochrome c [Lysobacter terrigena]
MSSRFRIEPLFAALAACTLLLVVGCERERREYHTPPSGEVRAGPRLTDLQPGARMPDAVDPRGPQYQDNAFHVTQGGRWFKWFNCNGCHANGGGGMGPALMDDEWRYGSSIDQIHATILDGRPNGMPSFRGKVTDQQAWELAAYVLSLSGNVRKDAAPSRSEQMLGAPPPTQTATRHPKGGDTTGVQAPPP